MCEPVVGGVSAARALDELLRLRRCTPFSNAPVRQWVAWLEEQAPWWDVLAARDATFGASAQFVADHVRRTIKELRARFQPHEQWPKAWTW